MSRVKLLLGLMSLLVSHAAISQDPTVLPSAPVFTFDVKTYETKGTIPYDKPFVLLLKNLDVSVRTVTTDLYEGHLTGSGTPVTTTTTQVPVPAAVTATTTSNAAVTMLVTLRANGKYRFHIKCNSATGVQQEIDYGFTLKTKLGDYIKPDLGLGYAPVLKGFITQTSIHFYLLPINDDTDLRTVSGFGRNIFLRTSVFVGVSPVTLHSNPEHQIVNGSSLGNLLVGVGIRSPFYGKHMPFGRNTGWVFLQPLRINIGQMYFKQADANPLLTQNRDKHAFYYGISYDLSIAGLLGPLGKLFKP